MGLLTAGTPLSWQETKKHARLVQKVGVKQFLATFHRLKVKKGDVLLWGDELEHTLATLDHEEKRARMSLMGPLILEKMMEPEMANPDDHDSKWKPEYGSFMIESSPGSTIYGSSPADFNKVEPSMRLRRQQLYDCLKDTKTFPLTLGHFPQMGCPGATDPPHGPDPMNSASRSLYLANEITWSGHPRYITLTRNIRERRGEKVTINVPVFKDVNTPSPFKSFIPNDDEWARKNALDDHIFMDAMGFGMGCPCLQVTFQTHEIDEARLLYDHLAAITGPMLAISSASPIWRGYLAEWECRWNVISAAVDDRTQEEKGLKPLQHDQYVIPKSRFDSLDMYLANPKYNDTEIVYDKELFQELKDGGVDDLLAQHVAHLFVRDPISLFAESVEQDENEMGHFENIQSTVWQNMRFKPPPPDSPIGWRIEFRPLELQMTDFENAAYIVFVVLLTRAILSYRLNLYIPISKMQENMQRAQIRDSLHREMFYFRKDLFPEDESGPSSGGKAIDDEYTLMSINTIFNGKDNFPGLVPLVREYVNNINFDVETRCTILKYLALISKRASGELMTSAAWIRKFVTSHPDYKQDSVAPNTAIYELIARIKEASDGVSPIPEMTGNLVPVAPLMTYDPPTTSTAGQ